jgi:hypothetical protein
MNTAQRTNGYSVVIQDPHHPLVADQLPVTTRAGNVATRPSPSPEA